jgi:hypothetical protein
MDPVFWLLLWVINGNGGGYPLHVGNFPDMASCEKAAQEVKKSAPDTPNSFPVFACVQANTGKSGDPDPPN